MPPHRTLIAAICALIAPSSLPLLFVSSSGLRFLGALIATSSLFFAPPSSPPHRFRLCNFGNFQKIRNFWENPCKSELVAAPRWVFAHPSCKLPISHGNRILYFWSERIACVRQTNIGPGLLTFAQFSGPAAPNIPPALQPCKSLLSI